MTAFDVPDDLDDDPRLWTGESMMPVPEPTVCPTCKGYGLVIHSLNADVGLLRPCFACTCEVCGQPTETPPLCRDCHEAERLADEDAAKAYREGRYE